MTLKKTFHCAIYLTSYFLAVATLALGKDKPTWKFSVVVAVEQQTATYYENTYAKPIATIIREQMATVNANFNSTDQFNGVYDFSVDSVYVVEGALQNDLFKPHPGFDYKVVVDGFAASPSGGGWYGSYRLIYHKWTWNEFDGPFAQYATDGLTHEFAHSRGATDIYGMKVDADKNPINNKAFNPIKSIMDYPYGNITWDEHTVNLLNRTGPGEIVGEEYITAAFPKKIAVRVRDSWGDPLSRAMVQTYPVDWFSYRVTTQPISRGTTDDRGEYVYPSNPFGPGASNSPWAIRYPNFLVRVTYFSDYYQWMPLYEVQNSFFKYGPDSTYYLDFVIPPRPASIQIRDASKIVVCTGDRISISGAPFGSFNQKNTFMLQLSDPAGSFDKPIILDTLESTFNIAMGGMIPNVPTGFYKLRVVSSIPEVISNEFPIQIQATPGLPTVADVSICQNAPAPTLVATGQQLLWYSSAIGGVGSPTSPTVSTAQPLDTTFYVSQSVGSCVSPRAPIHVNVQALPTLSLTGGTSIYVGEETPLTLKFTGQAPHQYQLSNGLNGSATQDTILLVSPKSTLSYVVQGVSNACGPGQAGSSSSATITVQYPLLETQAFTPTSYCPGSAIKVGFKKTGRFATGTSFKIQIAPGNADSSQATYVDLPVSSVGDVDVTGTLPSQITAGHYRVRVIATHPAFVINGSVSPTTLTVLSVPSATLSGGQEIIGRDTARLSVAFTGVGPWTFSYRAVFDNSIGTEFTVTTANNPYLLRLLPLITTTYSLSSVRNTCGNGTFSTDGILVKVIPLLSTPTSETSPLVELFPVPTTGTLTLRIREYASQKIVHWELYNPLGQLVMQQEVRDEESVLSLVNQPAGLYLLRVQVGDKFVVRRIVKK